MKKEKEQKSKRQLRIEAAIRRERKKKIIKYSLRIILGIMIILLIKKYLF